MKDIFPFAVRVSWDCLICILFRNVRSRSIACHFVQRELGHLSRSQLCWNFNIGVGASVPTTDQLTVDSLFGS